MGNFWLKVKIWTKTTLFAIVVLYLLLFLYNNSGDKIHFWWWFGHEEDHGKLTFAFASFMAGVILTILVRTTVATMRQVQDLQSRSRSQRVERDVQDMKDKAARLQTRTVPAGTTVPGAFEAPLPRTDETGV